MLNLLMQLGRRLVLAIEWIRKRRYLHLAFNALLIIILVLFVGSYLVRDWDQLKGLEINVNFQLIVISFLYYGVNYVLLSLSWHVLFKTFNPHVGWWENLQIYSYSNLMRFLPTPVWFIASRAVLYEKVGTSKRIAVVTTVIETILHVISGLGLLLFLYIDLRQPLTILPFLICLGLILFVILRSDLLQHVVITGEAHKDYSLRPKDTALILLLFTFTWLIAAPFYSVIIRSIVSVMPMMLTDLWEVWILSSLISYLSTYTLGGIGMLREFSMTLLLDKWFSPPIALIITILLRLIMTLAGIFWSLIAIGLVKIYKALRGSRYRSNDDSLSKKVEIGK